MSSVATRGPMRAAVLFTVLHVAAFALAGELLGSFGDADSTFSAYFARAGTRATTLAGSLLLTMSSVVLLRILTQFSLSLRSSDEHSASMVSALAIVATTLWVTASASLATVPGAQSFGFGDTGQLSTMEAVLPQLAFVLWVVGVLVLAATIVVLSRSARRAEIAEPWFARVSLPIGVLVSIGAPSVLVPALVLPAWTILAARALQDNRVPAAPIP